MKIFIFQEPSYYMSHPISSDTSAQLKGWEQLMVDLTSVCWRTSVNQHNFPWGGTDMLYGMFVTLQCQHKGLVPTKGAHRIVPSAPQNLIRIGLLVFPLHWTLSLSYSFFLHFLSDISSLLYSFQIWLYPSTLHSPYIHFPPNLMLTTDPYWII